MKIGILGKMGSGKSTLANMIIDKDVRYTRYAFGDKVKEIAKNLFGMIEKDRNLLQTIGGKMREIDDCVWVNYVINQIKNTSFVVIDDVRYENEVLTLKKNGFKIIYLDIDNNTQIERLKLTYPNTYLDHINNGNHESEKANLYSKYADIILKNYTILQLQEFIIKLVD